MERSGECGSEQDDTLSPCAPTLVDEEKSIIHSGCGSHRGHDYRFISNISTVLYFFNIPPPRAINRDVPLLETVPLLFQPHFRGMFPCQIHVRHTHFRVFFAGTDNEFTQCAYNGD